MTYVSSAEVFAGGHLTVSAHHGIYDCIGRSLANQGWRRLTPYGSLDLGLLDFAFDLLEFRDNAELVPLQISSLAGFASFNQVYSRLDFVEPSHFDPVLP